MIIKRRTYEKRIDDALEVGNAEGVSQGIEQGYKQGVNDGIKAAIANLLSSNCIIFNDKTGYGSSKEIAVNLDSPESIREVVELLGGGLS